MARKRASDKPSVPQRQITKRAAAPGNMNENELQRAQEAAARAASTPRKSKKSAADRIVQKVTPKKSAPKKIDVKKAVPKKGALKKVKGSRVDKAKPKAKSTKKTAEPVSPPPDLSEASEEEESDYEHSAAQTKGSPKKRAAPKVAPKKAKKIKEISEDEHDSGDETEATQDERLDNVVDTSGPGDEGSQDLGHGHWSGSQPAEAL